MGALYAFVFDEKVQSWTAENHNMLRSLWEIV